MQAERCTLLGVLGRLGTRERSFRACAPEGGCSPYLTRVVLVTMSVSWNGPECSQHHLRYMAIEPSPIIKNIYAPPGLLSHEYQG